MITSSLDMTVKLWDPLSLECISTLDCVGDSAMALETVGNWILVAGTNSVKIWEWASRRLYRILDGCRWPILWQDGLLYCATYDIPQNIQVCLSESSSLSSLRAAATQSVQCRGLGWRVQGLEVKVALLSVPYCSLQN